MFMRNHIIARQDLRWRPYRVERTGSLPTSEVKRRRARLVLGWGTAREDLRVLPALCGVMTQAFTHTHMSEQNHTGWKLNPNPCEREAELDLPDYRYKGIQRQFGHTNAAKVPDKRCKQGFNDKLPVQTSTTLSEIPPSGGSIPGTRQDSILGRSTVALPPN